MTNFLAKRSVLAHLILLYLGKSKVSEFSNEKHPRNKQDIKNKKVILIVGMLGSPHLHAWIDGIAESNLNANVWVFPSDFPEKRYKHPKLRVRAFPFIFLGRLTNYAFRILDILTKKLWRSYFLNIIITLVKPTHLHFHELQHGAYLYNSIAHHPRNRFSGMVLTSTWGSDIIVYGNTDTHKKEIENVLSWTDILTSERTQDFEVALRHGFKGRFEAPIYITVGNRFSISSITNTSMRNSVVIKGYQDNHGRSLNAIQAVVEVSKMIDLKGYTFYVYSASESVKLQIELLALEFGIKFVALPRMSKGELMQYFERARAYIGIAISDGLSTSMVEAMAHGAFPIQSKNSSAPEFLVHGATGGIVDPWDISSIASILKLALTDDALVDAASVLNKETIVNLYSLDKGRKRIEELYSYRNY